MVDQFVFEENLPTLGKVQGGFFIVTGGGQMENSMISSTGNSQIKEIEKLQRKARARKDSRTFVVEGRKMVEEAGGRIVRLYLSESYYEECGRKTGLDDGYTFEVVSDKVFREISDTMTPQGILAIVKMPEYQLEELLLRENSTFLLLEDVRDPGNLGTIMRTAEGAGVSAVLLSRDSVDLFNPKVVRSTMGSIFRMPFVYVEDFLATVSRLKDGGVVIYAAHLRGTSDYDRETYAKSCGIIIGNEANGITDAAADMADCLVKIPMEGKVESLNAAIAAGLMMYEVYRQRRIQ